MIISIIMIVRNKIKLDGDAMSEMLIVNNV